MARRVSLGIVKLLLVLGALACFAVDSSAQNIVESSNETRFQLDLHVPEAALAMYLPPGWTSNAATQGAAKDAAILPPGAARA